jgi:transposase
MDYVYCDKEVKDSRQGLQNRLTDRARPVLPDNKRLNKRVEKGTGGVLRISCNIVGFGVQFNRMVKAMGSNKFEQYEKTRLQGVALLKQKQPVAKVAAAVGVSRQTVYNWKKRGFGEDAKIKPGGRPRKLNDKQRAKLRTILDKSPQAFGFQADTWTGERIARVIQSQFNVEFNPKSIPQMLRNWGWEWRKPAKGKTATKKAAAPKAKKPAGKKR